MAYDLRASLRESGGDRGLGSVDWIEAFYGKVGRRTTRTVSGGVYEQDKRGVSSIGGWWGVVEVS